MGAGFKQEAVKRRVLVGDVRGRSGTFQIQAADNDVEHGGDGCQLHPVKHGRHLRRHRVNLRVVSAHGWPEKKDRKIMVAQMQNKKQKTKKTNKHLNKKRKLVEK